jgi:hypothetical protein
LGLIGKSTVRGWHWHVFSVGALQNIWLSLNGLFMGYYLVLYLCSPYLSLSFGNQVLPKCQQQGDEFIMQLLIQPPTFCRDYLISCNQCHLTIEAVTLADIVTRDGTKCIQSNYIGGHLNLTLQSQWKFLWKNPLSEGC